MFATDDSQVAEAIAMTGFYVLGGALVAPLFKWAVRGARLGTRAAMVGGMCFAAGTPMATPDGLRAIEELQPGDWVMASPPTGGEPVPKRVVRTFHTPLREVVGLALMTSDGSTDVLRVTKDHPFGLVEGGWSPAQALRSGDALVTASGEVATVVAAWSEAGLEDVFNVEVEDLHTYFVGIGGVWAHNSCRVPGAQFNLLPQVEARFTMAGRQFHDVNPTFRRMVFRTRGLIPTPAGGKGLTAANRVIGQADAEIGAMFKAYRANLRGGSATLEILGLPACKYCRSDIKKMAQLLQLDELLIVERTTGRWFGFHGPQEFLNVSQGGKLFPRAP